MTSTFFKYKHYPVYITDRTTYEKLKCICEVPRNGNINADMFNEWLVKTIEKEYERRPSPLGV